VAMFFEERESDLPPLKLWRGKQVTRDGETEVSSRTSRQKSSVPAGI